MKLPVLVVFSISVAASVQANTNVYPADVMRTGVGQTPMILPTYPVAQGGYTPYTLGQYYYQKPNYTYPYSGINTWQKQGMGAYPQSGYPFNAYSTNSYPVNSYSTSTYSKNNYPVSNGNNSIYNYYPSSLSMPMYPQQYPMQMVRPQYPVQSGTMRPPMQNSVQQQAPKKKVTKAWGDVRHIWPDFYTDFTDDAWDWMMSTPRDMGYMPGGWRFPYISMPDPVTVGDAVANQIPPIMEEVPNFVPVPNQ
jgi:hypothetical protein